jgi:hypothetical protein
MNFKFTQVACVAGSLFIVLFLYQVSKWYVAGFLILALILHAWEWVVTESKLDLQKLGKVDSHIKPRF